MLAELRGAEIIFMRFRLECVFETLCTGWPEKVLEADKRWLLDICYAAEYIVQGEGFAFGSFDYTRNARLI